jgi:benzoylformate decarboxylase
VYLAIPEDVQAGPADADGARAFTARPTTALGRRPDRDAVAAAARLLAAAQRPILVLGPAAASFASEARALAGALELPVFAVDRTQLSTLPYPVRDPRYLGQYGEERRLIDDADCVLAVGGRVFFPFSSESTPRLPAQARLIHAHADPAQVGWTIAPDVGLTGVAGAVLADLRGAIEALGGLSADVRAARIARLSELRARYLEALERERARHDALAERAHAVSLARLAVDLGDVLPGDALVFDEAISSSRALLRLTPFPDGVRVHRTSGGSLGWGVPAAVGAKIAAPQRAVVAVVGDGSFHFTPQALWTAARENAPVVVIVLDNSGYLAVKLAIERHVGVKDDPRTHPGTALPSIDHVSVARGYGADARTIEDPAALRPAIEAALASPRSTVLVVPVPQVRS